MAHQVGHDDEEKYYFDLRKEGKVYISKLFSYDKDSPSLRNAIIVFENTSESSFGEFQGATKIRISPKGKNQVAAVVFQDSKKINRIALTSFRQTKNGTFISTIKDSFTFRDDEFQRLLEFLKSIEFIDFSNTDNFQIEDRSSQSRQKAIVDKADANLLMSIRKMTPEERAAFLNSLRGNLNNEEIELLLGRKQALEDFKKKLESGLSDEKAWQIFFEKNYWIFGYGLDYRLMQIFDREMVVGHGGTANKEKPIVDFLTTFTNFTALGCRLIKPEPQSHGGEFCESHVG